MGSGYVQLPVAPYRPAEQVDPITAAAKLQQLRNLQQQGQLGQQQIQGAQLQNQGMQQQLEEKQALNDAYKQSITTDPTTGQPSFDSAKLQKALEASGHGSVALDITGKLQEFEKTNQALQEGQNKLRTQAQDSMGIVGAALKQAKYDPQVADVILQHQLQVPGLPPQTQQQLQQMRQQIQQNPQSVQQIAEQLIVQSPAQREMAAKELDAQARMASASKKPEGEQPLGNTDQFNQLLTQRYQVLHPGQPLPLPFQLGPNATQKDFDRIDKVLSSTESALGTKAQQDTANVLRQQTATLAQQNAADRQDKEGLQPVVGTDASGNRVLVSAGDAKKMGLTGTMKADADEVNKSEAARTWLKLATKIAPNDSPADQMGIMQLVDKLDKDGKLGVAASRWNEFLSGKLGAGDPDFSALRAKIGLSTTKLMQAHVGSRGGSYLIEHFEDLANAKKMDAATLRAGLSSEVNYMNDVAMLPTSATPQNKSASRPSLSSFEK